MCKLSGPKWKLKASVCLKQSACQIDQQCLKHLSDGGTRGPTIHPSIF